MSDLSLKKILLPAALTTGALFTALTAPMFVFAAQPIKVQAMGEVVPGEQVRDYAAPYMGVAGLLSVGIGLSGAAVVGWRRSSGKANSLDHKLEVMQRQLDDRTAYLQAALTSDTYLAKSGLDFFLSDEAAGASAPQPRILVEAVAVPIAETLAPESSVVEASVMQFPALTELDSKALRFDDLPDLEAFFLGDLDAVSPVLSMQAPVETPAAQEAVVAIAQPSAAPRGGFTVVAATTAEPTFVQASPPPLSAHAMSPLMAAQGFLSYSRVQSGAAPWNPVMAAQEQVALAKIQALQSQLQQIVVQIETLQTNLQPEATPGQGWVAATANPRPQPSEVAWVPSQRIAS
jgi:hypothetical protein